MTRCRLAGHLRGFYPLTIAQQFVATSPGANETFTPWGFTSTQRIPGLTVGIPAFTGPDLSTGVVTLPGTVQMRSPYEGVLKRGYIQSWNLMIERKLFSDVKIEVGYVGTGTRNQFGDFELNAAQTPNSTRLLQQKYGRTASTLMWDGLASTSYHALQIAVNRRYSQGLFLKGAYTWSKAINFFDDSGWAGFPLFQAASDIGRNRGLAGFDIPHNLQIGAAYELPFGRGKKYVTDGVGAAILGGWTLSGIGSMVSGRPLNVTAAGRFAECARKYSNSGYDHQRRLSERIQDRTQPGLIRLLSGQSSFRRNGWHHRPTTARSDMARQDAASFGDQGLSISTFRSFANSLSRKGWGRNSGLTRSTSPTHRTMPTRD